MLRNTRFYFDRALLVDKVEGRTVDLAAIDLERRLPGARCAFD